VPVSPANDEHHPARLWLAHLADQLGAEAGGMFIRHADGRHAEIATGYSEAALHQYRDHYARLDPLPDLLAARPAGRALILDTTRHPAYRAQRELCADFLRPHGIDHIAAARWSQPDGSVQLIGVQRFRGAAPFSAADGRELDRLLHHWRIDMARPPTEHLDPDARGDSRRHCDVAAQLGIALALVDTRLAIIWANPAAHDARGDAWAALFDRRITHPHILPLRRQLQDLVLQCMRQHCETEIRLDAPDGLWIASAAPLVGRPGLAVLRLNALSHLRHGITCRLQRLFALTPAEADMTALLANGASLESIAAARKVTLGTVRTQLRTVFRKTETHRQGELVSLVLKMDRG
jgi:DNA-binding CsgD family transcriptional regulator